MNVDAIGWSAVVGAVSAAIASLLTLWWTKGTESRVRLIKAQSDAHHRSQSDIILQKDTELARKDEIIMEKNELIANHAHRLEILERNIEQLREQGHAERNKWYQEQLKCHADNAELRGQLAVVTSQLQQLYSYMYPAHPPLVPPISTPSLQAATKVEVVNPPSRPVPTVDSVSPKENPPVA